MEFPVGDLPLEDQGSQLHENLPAPITQEEKVQDQYAQKEENLKNRILNDSVNAAREKYDPRTHLEAFVKEVSKQFIEKKIDAFPELCDICRIQNLMKRQELEKTGNRGRFTGKSGFSRDGNSFFRYEIPRELYLFMVNLVYWDFWGPENHKVADTFMRKIIRGDEATQILMWVKSIYGANSQEGIVV